MRAHLARTIGRFAAGTRRATRASGKTQPLRWPISVSDANAAVWLGDRGTDIVAIVATNWCSPGTRMVERLGAIAAQDALLPVVIDPDEAPKLSAQLGVRAIPTVLFLRDRRECGRRIGELSRDELEDWIAAMRETCAEPAGAEER